MTFEPGLDGMKGTRHSGLETEAKTWRCDVQSTGQEAASGPMQRTGDVAGRGRRQGPGPGGKI